jgi:CRISPR system Cascade subunit CasB
MNQGHHQAFVKSLVDLASRDTGAMAALRRSLAFDPGNDPKAYPYVERYVPRELRGKAMYAVAGFFAFNPEEGTETLATSYGHLVQEKMRHESKGDREGRRTSLESRFIALLDADPEGVVTHLRQIVSLLKASGRGYDHAALLNDLRWLLDEQIGSEWRDRVRRTWARQFYGAVRADDMENQTAAASAEQ